MFFFCMHFHAHLKDLDNKGKEFRKISASTSSNDLHSSMAVRAPPIANLANPYVNIVRAGAPALGVG